MVLAYFGRRWDAPVTDRVPQIEVPVGEPCVFCPDAIGAEDRGMFIIAARNVPGSRAIVLPTANGLAVQAAAAHLECWLCSSMASVEHLKRFDAGLPCGQECNEGIRPIREEGRAMMEYYAQRGGPL